MADNTVLNPGVNGDTVRDIDRSQSNPPIAAKTQVVQLDAGGENQEYLITQSQPMPVVDNSDNQADDPDFVVLVGDPAGDFAGVSILEQVATDSTGIYLNTKVVNPELRDANGAIVLSDAKPISILCTAVGQQFVIDTTGYNSLNISTLGFTATVTGGNDLSGTFTALSGFSLVINSNYISTLTANGNFSYPCAARYIRLTSTAIGSATLYLRAAPWAAGYNVAPAVSINDIAGIGVVTAANGVIAVGGNVAAGAAPTASPVLVAGIDTSGLTRRPLTDTTGVLAVGGNVTAGTAASGNPAPMGGADTSAITHRLLTNFLGSPIVELTPTTQANTSLPELIKETNALLRVMLHYMFNEQLQSGLISASDEPDVLLKDMLDPSTAFSNLAN